MNAEEGWEQWCVSCEENMVVKYRCHFDVSLSDESGTLPTDLYTPDAEMLLGCDAVQLEGKNMPLPLLEATIKTALEDKHVVRFIKVYDRLFKVVNMRTFSIVNLYTYEDLYPATKVIPHKDNAETFSIALEDITADCSLAKTTDVQTEFFTPSTKNVLNELTHEIIQPAEQDQPIGLKISLFPVAFGDTGASAIVPKPSTPAVEKNGDSSLVTTMEITSPVKKNKNEEKPN